ncbi:MAG: SDR family NAD(P)-dependent oxidoreductase, partial [Proteobacteria bacterium]|nr:SDR family NAD(P)-dependent oxidoreductase [Pseudomonadota bacterium]
MELLKNKVIVVTGGAGLLGEAFVNAVSENGATVIIADVDSVRSKEIIASRKNIDYFKLNITSKSSIVEMIDYVTSKYGKIDAVVNNAYPRNKNYGRKFEEVTYEDFCENVNLHLGGYFLVSQQLAEFFSKQGYGNIVNIASIYGFVTPRFEIYENTKMTVPVEYATIKSALIHLTKYIAKYYK